MAGLFGELRCFCLFVCFSVSSCFTNSLDLDFQPKTTKVVSLHIKSSILYRFSSTSVTSTIINDDVRATETFFEVTLPDAAFISNFTLEIDGNVYQGEIKEKEVAKNTYENARWMGQSAGHIETRPRDTNKFKISINIAAFSEVTFTLTYNELLQRRRGNYDHTIYVNPGQIVDSLLVEVTIQESHAITQLHVPPLRDDILTEHQNSLWNTYATIRRPSLTSAYIRYNPSPEDQKRASLQGMSGLFIVEYDVERTTNVGEVMVVNGYFVHYFAPQGLPRMKRKVLFILDYSGSMLGTKITQLKTAMSEILSNLAKGDRFNIIRFNGDVTKWWNHSALVEVNEYSVSAAKNFINDMEADGWTNINGALTEGLELLQEDDERDPTYASLMIFLTDGYATEGEVDNSKILDTISSKNKDKVPIFSLSFGDEADYSFLKKLSAQNNGFVRKIYEESDASLQLTGFYGEVASTLLSNLTFRYLDDTVVGKSVTNTIYPIFFAGSEIVISGKVSEVNVSAMTLEICGTSSKGPLEWRTATGNNIFDLIQNAPSELVASNFSDITEKIWAYMTIKQLLINRLRERNATARTELKRKALELALKYNFVTPLTSMVVTRPQDENVIRPSADFRLNDSPYSVWGDTLKGSLELKRNKLSFVDNDPHFIVRVKGLKDAVCFDVMGNEGDVFNLVKDEISGIIVNAKVATSIEGSHVLNSTFTKHRNGSQDDKSNLKTYFGEITISGDRSVINVSPDQWTVNGVSYKWRPAQTITVHRTKLVTDGTGKMIAIMFPHKITLLIVRHMRTEKQLEMGKIHFLGFYIVDDRGFSWYTHGLLGQFIYRRISLEKKKTSKIGKTRGKLKIEGNTKRMRRVSALLGKRVNLAINAYVSCWMVQRNGRRLIDGVFTDYLVTNSTSSSQDRKRKRSKT